MPTKPERIHGKQVLAYIDGIPTRRVQSIDYNSGFDIDTIYELGNSSFVEESIDNVNTAVTMSSNEWGTTDLEAMVFGKYRWRTVVYSATSTHFVIGNAKGFNSGYPATLCNAGDWLMIFHMGGTITTDYVKVASNTLAAASFGYIVVTSPTYKCTMAPPVKSYAAKCNKYTLTGADLDNQYVDLILPYRYSATSTNCMYSVLLPRCSCNNLSYRFDTGGAAEVSFGFDGEEERLTLGSVRELQECVASFIGYTSGATNGTLTLAVPTAHELMSNPAQDYLVYADANVATRNDITITAATRRVTATIAGGTGLGLSSTGRYRVFYYRSPANIKGFRGVTNITNAIGKLKKGYIDVAIGTLGDSTLSKLQRVSGVDITIGMAKESLSELGNDKTYGRQSTDPFKAEITLSFTKNDLREYAYLTNQVAAFDAGTLREILMSSLKSSKNTQLSIKLYNHRTTHTTNTLLKTFLFTSCNFTGDSTTTPVTGNSGMDLKFSSANMTITGSGLPPIYS